jgi:ferredoxin-NADP reductase
VEEHKVKILQTRKVTHNVRSFTVEKPKDYDFRPGQATEISINKIGFENEKRPFSFTSLPEDANLEFTIKIYPDHNGVTNELGNIKVGEYLFIHDVWGVIEYKGSGTFIAGGAGVTPFICILRYLNNKNNIENNKLIFSNKTFKDIILYDEFKTILGKNFINILTDETRTGFYNSRIDINYLKNNITDFNQRFYICGPPPFVESISASLTELGAKTDAIIFEK